MGAEKETLLEIKAVTDHDTGDYYVGEIDWADNGKLQEYIERYGRKGVERLHSTLSYWTYEIERRVRELPSNGLDQCCASCELTTEGNKKEK